MAEMASPTCRNESRLVALKAMSAEWGRSLEKRKAEALAQVAEAEAMTAACDVEDARLAVAAEISRANSSTIPQLCGGRVQ